MLLDATDLRAGYGNGPDVLDDVAVEVAEGEIVALIGLNGAGKSTLVRTLCGMLPARAGTVHFDGEDVTSIGTDERSRRGLMLVPEGRQLFPSLTVADVLRIGTVPVPRRERPTTYRRQLDLVVDLFPVLDERFKQQAGTLSGGEQQMLAIARALMSDPRMLVLDEPSLGLAPRVITSIFASLTRLNRDGLTIMLVEQNARFAIDSSNRAYLMELGKVIHSAPSTELRDSDRLTTLISGVKAGASTDDEKPVKASTIPAYTSNAARHQHNSHERSFDHER